MQHGVEKKGVSRDKIKAPPGWSFSDESPWRVDINRVVDEEGMWVYISSIIITNLKYLSLASLKIIHTFIHNHTHIHKHTHTHTHACSPINTHAGWEYTVQDGVNMQYVPYERNIHHSRRRRWIRVRVRDSDYKAQRVTIHVRESPKSYTYIILL